MSEYPKKAPGRCELHNAVLYADLDGYRCWPCEDQRIQARQALRAGRPVPGAAYPGDLAQARAALKVHSVNEGRLHARIAELETAIHAALRLHGEGWPHGDLLRAVLNSSAASATADTLSEIEVVCALLGYEPDGGQPVTEWIDAQLRGSREEGR